MATQYFKKGSTLLKVENHHTGYVWRDRRWVQLHEAFLVATSHDADVDEISEEDAKKITDEK